MHLVIAMCTVLVQDPAAEPAAEEPGRDPAPAEAAGQEVPAWKTALDRVTLGGQARFRGEYRDFLSYADTPAAREDDDLYLSRIRLALTFSVDEDLDLFFQPQDQRTFGDEASVASDENNLDVHQAYVDWRNLLEQPVDLRVGRMELQYGDQRLVSPLDWSNVGRAWDGVRLRYGDASFWVDGFATVVKEGVAAEEDRDFFGLYASCREVEGYEFDVYVLGRAYGDGAFLAENGAPGDLRDATYGGRVKGGRWGFDYTFEAAGQAGTISDDHLRAWALAATLGYTCPHAWKPRLGVEYTFATGDEDPTDGDRETFDPPFTFGHFYQGFADVFAWKNGEDFVIKAKASPVADVTVFVDVHTFRLDETADAWYNAGGNVIRRDPTGAADDRVGTEVDVHVKWKAHEHVSFWGGYSRFFAGPYVEDTAGTERDMDWVFAQMLVSF